MPRRPDRINRGDVLRLRYLRRLEDAIIDTQDALGRVERTVGTLESRSIADPENSNLAPGQLYDENALDAAGELPAFTLKVFREYARTSETVRVTNPEDSEQFVDVARPTDVHFVTDEGDFLSLVFDNA